MSFSFGKILSSMLDFWQLTSSSLLSLLKQNGLKPSAMNMQSLRADLQNVSNLFKTSFQTDVAVLSIELNASEDMLYADKLPSQPSIAAMFDVPASMTRSMSYWFLFLAFSSMMPNGSSTEALHVIVLAACL